MRVGLSMQCEFIVTFLQQLLKIARPYGGSLGVKIENAILEAQGRLVCDW